MSSRPNPSSRRDFLRNGVLAAGLAAAAAPLSRLPFVLAADAPPAKPNSVINGVRIGCITYSYRGGVTAGGGRGINTAEDTLKALLQDGLSEVELMDGPIRAYAGITGGRGPRGGRGRGGAPPATQPAELTDAERAQQRYAQLAKCLDLRRMYNDAGVNIHIHKMPFGPSDEEIDFNFNVAKALGCVAITTERNEALARRLAPFADKHKVWVAFHNHTDNVPVTDQPDPILELGQYIGFNLDIGHYFAGTKGKSPVPVIEKYHDRIISLHLKDRTPDGRNLSWGKGQTPIKEVLQLLKKEKWPIYADIELEYPVPEGSDSVAEVAKCLQYCREALA
jgi:sugar phosphate isomerase/epimerase